MQGKGLGVLVLLPHCPQWWHSGWMPSARAVLVPGQFGTQEDSSFARQGLPSSRARTPALVLKWWQGPPCRTCAAFGGESVPGPPVLGVPGSRVLLQTCPGRLLWAACRLALGNLAECTGENTPVSCAGALLRLLPSSRVGTANAGNYNRRGSSPFWNENKRLEANLRSEDWPLVSDSSRDAFLPAKDNHN